MWAGLRRRHSTDRLRLTRAASPYDVAVNGFSPTVLQCNQPQAMSRQFTRIAQFNLGSFSASADRLKTSSDIIRLCSTNFLKTFGDVNPAFAARSDLVQRLSSHPMSRTGRLVSSANTPTARWLITNLFCRSAVDRQP